MYRASYTDLQWEMTFLDPVRYTLRNGLKEQLNTPESPGDWISISDDCRTASVGMPAGRGKISDAGYDQMVCLSAKIPVYDHVRFRARVRILQYPLSKQENGQEGLGLFLRDTMDLDRLTGYPYSNMAAGGIFHGKVGMIGRQGITPNSIEHIQNLSCMDDQETISSFIGKKLDIILEKQGTGLLTEIRCEGETKGLSFTMTADDNIFGSRDPDWMFVGFLTARGCQLEIDLDTVYIEYSNQADMIGKEPLLYASPKGSPIAKGSLEEPLTLQTAIDRCLRGQTVCVLPGWYKLTEDLIIAKKNSGSQRYPKKIRVENSSGEPAVLDFGGNEYGLLLEGDHWEISGLTVTRGYGFVIRGSHNRIKHCSAVCNLETGFLIRDPANDSPKEQWPADNEVSDCVSCLNRDISGQHADGFACKIAAGDRNVFLRCTAWMNSDDGFDLFSKNRSIGSVRMSDCKAWLNGFTLQDGVIKQTEGNGNGFKLGGSGLSVEHEVLDCEAIGNRGYGFTSNSNPCMRLSSCRGGNNQNNFVFYYTGQESDAVYIAENCIEVDDVSFDLIRWFREKILPDVEESALASASGIIDAVHRNSIKKHNESVIRNALEDAALLCETGEDSSQAIMFMCSSLYGGGAERVACRLASGLAKRYKVYFLYIEDKGQSYYLDPRIQTISLPFFYGTWDVINTCRAEYVRKLKEILHIRVSISFMYTMNRVNVESGGNAKIICSERNNPMKRYPERMQEIDRLYAEADHVVFQSETVRSMFSEKVQDHGSIILNPIEVSCKKKESKHRIVNVGRLVPQKNQAMLIRAFASFYQIHRDYTLSFYGTGELFEELQSLAVSLGLGEAVQFHGQVWDVHAAIADAEMFVLSSDYEGLSNALLESMMMGLPCISTRCGGSVNVIEPEENGLLTDIGNEMQMSAAMTRLADNADLRDYLGMRAQRSTELFKTEPVLKQWESLIEQLSVEGFLQSEGE